MPTDAVLALPLPPPPPPEEWLLALAERTDGHALFVVDRGGRVRSWSEGAERLTGYTSEEALGRHVSVFYAAEELRAGAPEREVAEARAGSMQVEGWWTRKDGTRLWVHRVLTPLGGQEGAVGVVACDQTAARDALLRLQEREECYRSLFEHTGDAVLTLDLQGRVTGANAACEAATGLGLREMLGRPFDSLAAADDRERARDGAARAAHGEPHRVHLAIRRRDGRRLELDAGLAPIFIGGQPAGVFVVGRDVTERNREEARLRGAEERFRGMVEGATAGFFYVLDSARRFRYFSPAVRAVTGHPPERLLGLAFDDLLGAEAGPPATGPAAGGLPGSATFLATIHTATGEARVLEVSEGPVPGERKARQGFARDVTRWRELERQQALAAGESAGGVPNRVLFGERLARAIRLSSRDPGRMLAVLVVGLDGSAPGDAVEGAVEQLLAEVAGRLERCLRPGDTVCRLDGAELGVLLDGIREEDDAARVARRIEATLAAPFHLGRGEVAASASIGFAVSAAGRASPDELLRSAESARDSARRPLLPGN
ncbi:MAG TPA: sensor domain-containing diguanylate cyclase [Longimicrobiaceae bacterium]|nr:sensor domain-containing diguanylate cyclase [Longimicrobiaceae bacterium]